MAPSPEAARRYSHRRQGGAALLLFMLIVVIGASYMLLDRLNAGTIRTQSTINTVEALKIAKEALIGRAVSDDNRPGSLPCPDTNGDGDAELFSGNACPSYLGRLPYSTLELEELRDGSGAGLWYVLSENYRDHPAVQPLNSGTAGLLEVDGAGDIVAVIFAPGEPFDGQDRNAGPNDKSNFLEGENIDGDDVYSARVPGGNDLLAVITRRELMAAVERRVLGEVVSALRTYRAASWNEMQVFPWLSPYENPLSSAFKTINPAAVPPAFYGVSQGLLAVHGLNETFSTTFKLKWDLTGATLSNDGGTVSDNDLEQGEQTFTGNCDWIGDYTRFRCGKVPPPPYGGSYSETRTDTCNGEPNVTINRLYTVSFDLTDGAAEIKRPKNGEARRRQAKLEGDPLPGSPSFSLTITDTAAASQGSVAAGDLCGTGTAQVAGVTGGKLEVKDLPYDLGVPNELPAWFHDNQWHHLIYVAEAPSHSPVGDPTASDCQAASDCLTVVGLSPGNDKSLVVLVAGAALSGQDRSTGGGALGDYYELDNADGTSPFTRVDAAGNRPPHASLFNDQTDFLAHDE